MKVTVFVRAKTLFSVETYRVVMKLWIQYSLAAVFPEQIVIVDQYPDIVENLVELARRSM